ncbi:MAG: SpoIIE family protein phosphatase [Spirochaetes bacterium]|nr:SpoIIE family protein phosphatase [Spirochaetota bacterium]
MTIGYHETVKKEFINFIIKNSSLAAINIFLSISFLFFFLTRRKEKYYLYFSILSLSLSLWMTGYNGLLLHVIDNYRTSLLFTFIGSVVILIAIINFLHSFLELPSNWIKKIFELLYGFTVAIILVEIIIFDSIQFFSRYLFDYYILSSVFLILYGIYVSIIGVIKKKEYAVRVLVAVLILAAPTFIGIFDFLDIMKIDPPIFESFFIMNLFFASILASRYAKMHIILEKSLSDLLVLDKMKDDFLATTSHELRTPLHGIIGLTETLEEGTLGEVNGPQRESLELIRMSAERLNGLVAAILDFSKLRAGRADLLIGDVDIGNAAASVVSLVKSASKDRGLEFCTDLAPLPPVRADRNRVYQVLLNLVGNAVKFTEEGSVTVRTSSRDGAVRVEVIDTGPGIDAADLERIWDPFVQSEDPNTRKAGGAGLGLAISKYLVELHGGTIWAESEKGKGSAFIFELPLEAKAAGIERVTAPPVLPVTAAAAPPPETRAETPKRIKKTQHKSALVLAVEDDPVNLKVLEHLCAAAGYRLITTTNGPAGLRVVETEEVDLVLLDLMLPGMSGYEVCGKIRAMERGRYLPVIMLTARDQASDLLNGFECGANDYITKPFNRNELVMRIESQLAIKSLLDMERSVANGLRKEKESITGLFQRSLALKESTLQMVEWEHIIREDLDIAHAFQMKLMTHQRDIAGVETHIEYHPLLDVGGDLYDVFEVSPGVVRVFLADATGHGITASLNTVKILSEYAVIKEAIGSPADVVNFMNQRFTKSFSEYNIVFTCVVADINMAGSTLTMACAGHPHQLLVRRGGVVQIRPPGPIIGLSSGIVYTDETVDFEAGDVLFLFTDGLWEMIEAGNPGKNEAELLTASVGEIFPGKDLAGACEELLAHHGGPGIAAEDDITVIAIKRI